MHQIRIQNQKQDYPTKERTSLLPIKIPIQINDSVQNPESQFFAVVRQMQSQTRTKHQETKANEDKALRSETPYHNAASREPRPKRPSKCEGLARKNTKPGFYWIDERKMTPNRPGNRRICENWNWRGDSFLGGAGEGRGGEEEECCKRERERGGREKEKRRETS